MHPNIETSFVFLSFLSCLATHLRVETPKFVSQAYAKRLYFIKTNGKRAEETHIVQRISQKVKLR